MFPVGLLVIGFAVVSVTAGEGRASYSREKKRKTGEPISDIIMYSDTRIDLSI